MNVIKTPDEIKKGMKCCSGVGRCFLECPYYNGNTNIECIRHKSADALAYIQQLERERDAVVADIPRACGYCKWFEINRGGNMTECHNPNGCRNISGVNTGFEWRGVKEE